MRALIAGATGFVGTRLASSLRESGVEVRGIVRDRSRARDLERDGVELHEGDVLDSASLAGAGADVDMAYYLVHSMGRGGDDNFVERERSAARNFARMASAEGIGRVAYLGGLGGDEADSRHLRSRHETGEILRDEGPPLTYFRAAMVVGLAERVLPDAARSRETPAGHDRPDLARDADAADRHRRRDRLPRAGAPRGGRRRSRGGDRRGRRRLLRRDARPAWPARSASGHGRSCVCRS